MHRLGIHHLVNTPTEMNKEQSNNHWSEIRRRAELIIAHVDAVSRIDIGSIAKHEHLLAVKIDAECAAIRDIVGEVKVDLEGFC